MSGLATALKTALIQALWQDAVIGVVLGVVLMLLRRRSPNARYVAACVALAAMFVVPVLTMIAQYRRTTDPAAVTVVSARPVPAVTSYSQGTSRIWTDEPAAPQSVALPLLEAWTLPLWLAGVLVFSLRFVSAATHVTTLYRRGEPAADSIGQTVHRLTASMGIGRRVRVIVSAVATSPATIGWLRPIVILPPATVMGLPPEQLEAVLAHELAHVRRHDFAVNLLQMVVETLLFYHPAVWWASRRIRLERELCCDDAAVRSCGSAFDYAQALATIARWNAARTAGVLHATGGPLVDRVRRVLQPASPPSPRPSLAGVLVVVLAIGSTLGAERWVEAQSVRRSPAQPATLTLSVLDPLGARASDVQIVFEQGPFQDGLLFGDGRTDEAGVYTVRLPAGTYVFTGTTAFFPPTTVTLAPGETVHREIRMAVTAVSSSFAICIDCADGDDPYALPASIGEELQRDRDAAAAALIQEAEPVGGWEAFRPSVPPSLRQLDAAVQGTVVVEGRIGRDGRSAGLRVVEAAYPELGAAAVTALESQRWAPARVRGDPLEVPLRLTLDYVRQKPAPLRSEVASVKPNRSGAPALGIDVAGNRFTATNVPAQLIVRLAYAVPDHRIVDAPEWLRTERFDVVATAARTTSIAERNALLRSLLEERFKLVAHMEQRDLPIYALVRARPAASVGPGLRPAAAADCAGLMAARAKGQPLPPSNRILCGSSLRPGGVSVGGMTMAEIAGEVLSPQVERVVVDRTGLTGAYDFDLDFVRTASADPSAPGAASIFTAVVEQLGLRLEPARGPVDVLRIESIERPSPD
jgi:uncharacterized protein (TIGR03435 family)